MTGPTGENQDPSRAGMSRRSVEPIRGLDDPDIGMCDECGDADAPRSRMIVTRTFDGESQRLAAWLCQPCRAIEHRRTHCPDCGIHTSFHGGGVDCEAANERADAQHEAAQDAYEAAQEVPGRWV